MKQAKQMSIGRFCVDMPAGSLTGFIRGAHSGAGGGLGGGCHGARGTRGRALLRGHAQPRAKRAGDGGLCNLGRHGQGGFGLHGDVGDGDRRVERVRERSPPRDDFAHHDRSEWRLAEGHRQSHSEISGAFLLVLNWRPSDPVDDVELDHTDSTTWRGTEPRSRRAWPERSTFWAPVSEESGRNMPQQLLRAPS